MWQCLLGLHKYLNSQQMALCSKVDSGRHRGGPGPKRRCRGVFMEFGYISKFPVPGWQAAAAGAQPQPAPSGSRVGQEVTVPWGENGSECLQHSPWGKHHFSAVLTQEQPHSYGHRCEYGLGVPCILTPSLQEQHFCFLGPWIPSAITACSQASFTFPTWHKPKSCLRTGNSWRKEINLKFNIIHHWNGEIKSGKKEQEGWGHQAEVLDVLLLTTCCSALHLLLLCFLFWSESKQKTEITEVLLYLGPYLFTRGKENSSKDTWHTCWRLQVAQTKLVSRDTRFSTGLW